MKRFSPYIPTVFLLLALATNIGRQAYDDYAIYGSFERIARFYESDMVVLLAGTLPIAGLFWLARWSTREPK